MSQKSVLTSIIKKGVISLCVVCPLIASAQEEITDLTLLSPGWFESAQNEPSQYDQTNGYLENHLNDYNLESSKILQTPSFWKSIQNSFAKQQNDKRSALRRYKLSMIERDQMSEGRNIIADYENLTDNDLDYNKVVSQVSKAGELTALDDAKQRGDDLLKNFTRTSLDVRKHDGSPVRLHSPDPESLESILYKTVPVDDSPLIAVNTGSKIDLFGLRGQIYMLLNAMRLQIDIVGAPPVATSIQAINHITNRVSVSLLGVNVTPLDRNNSERLRFTIQQPIGFLEIYTVGVFGVTSRIATLGLQRTFFNKIQFSLSSSELFNESYSDHSLLETKLGLGYTIDL